MQTTAVTDCPPLCGSSNAQARANEVSLCRHMKVELHSVRNIAKMHVQIHVARKLLGPCSSDAEMAALLYILYIRTSVRSSGTASCNSSCLIKCDVNVNNNTAVNLAHKVSHHARDHYTCLEGNSHDTIVKQNASGVQNPANIHVRTKLRKCNALPLPLPPQKRKLQKKNPPKLKSKSSPQIYTRTHSRHVAKERMTVDEAITHDAFAIINDRHFTTKTSHHRDDGNACTTGGDDKRASRTKFHKGCLGEVCSSSSAGFAIAKRESNLTQRNQVPINMHAAQLSHTIATNFNRYDNSEQILRGCASAAPTQRTLPGTFRFTLPGAVAGASLAPKRKESPVLDVEDEARKKGRISPSEGKVSKKQPTHMSKTILRLQAAETIMPYFLHCHWRRGMTRRSSILRKNDDNMIRTRTRSAKHLGRTKYDRELSVQNSWRVSQLYISRESARRARRCQKQNVQNLSKQKYTYIGSKNQKQRMAYIYALHCTLYGYKTKAPDCIPNKNGAPNCIWNRALNMHFKSTYTSNTAENKLGRALHPARDRGERPGRPAGPGLPYGDCTGDDD